ncbi:hypothetical protein RCOM_0623210 [Ricinus communis]|uniref:Endonuclease/exonuclease/phosphatase domain-containing protein n=1 Tax=Ricinus communis TaxID=3988 RepID=B9STR2_RICCO|nr:hypothetical protein RCOM_0623210 [Ricinus communis]
MSVSLTVMTFNLYDDQPQDSPNSWETRRDLCISVITSYSPMILCTQQGVKSQLDYLQQGLPGYDQFGISRKGSQDTSDEHCTIFYEKEKVELLEGGTFWLSDAPSVPGSMSWGAAVPCIATWAISFFLVPVDEVLYSLGNTLHPYLQACQLCTVEDLTHRRNQLQDVFFSGDRGDKQGALEFLKLILRALCLCWDRQTQDLHVDWILFRGRSLIPSLCEVVNDNIDGYYPSSHYPIFAEFVLPRSVRPLEPPPTQEDN